jgi:hypothetical protein
MPDCCDMHIPSHLDPELDKYNFTPKTQHCPVHGKAGKGKYFHAVNCASHTPGGRCNCKEPKPARRKYPSLTEEETR